MNDIEAVSADLTPEEQKSLAEFKANGLPGLVRIDESDIAQWFNLYMSGKTYGEIAQITKKKKDLIVYISERSKWHKNRLDYFNDLAMHIVEKNQAVKIKSINALVTATSALSDYVSDEMNKYIQLKDKKIMKDMDTKAFANLIKAVETLNKLSEGGAKSDGGIAPNVNINLSAGASVKSHGEDGVEITTKTENGDILSLLANYKKSKET